MMTTKCSRNALLEDGLCLWMEHNGDMEWEFKKAKGNVVYTKANKTTPARYRYVVYEIGRILSDEMNNTFVVYDAEKHRSREIYREALRSTVKHALLRLKQLMVAHQLITEKKNLSLSLVYTNKTRLREIIDVIMISVNGETALE